MSFGSSSAAKQTSASTGSANVLQAAASPVAQPTIAPPPIPLPPPAANTPTFGSTLNSPGSAGNSPWTGQYTGEGTIATSPQGITGAPNTGKVTLLGK